MSETFSTTRQAPIFTWANVLQNVESAGIESRPRAPRMRGISISSSTRSRYVVAFFTFGRSRTTCCRSVNRFREYGVENRLQHGETAPSYVRRTGRVAISGGYPSSLALLARCVSRQGFQQGHISSLGVRSVLYVPFGDDP